MKIWVNSDVDTMKKRILERDAKRDYWKIINWNSYSSSLNNDLSIYNADYIIENQMNTPIIPQIDSIVENVYGK